MSLPNNSTATAIPMTFPFSVTVDFSLDTDFTGAWYSYTGADGDLYLGIHVTGTGTCLSLVYDDLALSHTEPRLAEGGTPPTFAMQKPVIVGNTYYIQLFGFNSQLVTMDARVLTAQLLETDPAQFLFQGMWVRDASTAGFPTILTTADGTVTRGVALPAGYDVIDSLPDGTICLGHGAQTGIAGVYQSIDLYTASYELIAVVPGVIPPPPDATQILISGDQVSSFYACASLATDSTLYQVSRTGAIVGTWAPLTMLPAGVAAIAAAIGGGTLYWSDSEESVIHAYDLNAAADLADVVPADPDFVVCAPLLVLSDGTFVAQYFNRGNHNAKIVHYAADGTARKTITILSNRTQFSRDPTDPNRLWVFLYQSTYRILLNQYDLTTGDVLNAITLDAFIDGTNRNGPITPFFGPDIGPFLVLSPVTPPPPPAVATLCVPTYFGAPSVTPGGVCVPSALGVNFH